MIIEIQGLIFAFKRLIVLYLADIWSVFYIRLRLERITMDNFWLNYLDSISQKRDKIIVRLDTGIVGNYDNIDEARKEVANHHYYETDRNYFEYREFNSKEWKKLY